MVRATIRNQQTFTSTDFMPTGDVIYLNVAGQPAIILNTQKAASDLLDRRAATNSGRPRLIVGHELICGGLFFALEPHTDR